MFGSKKFKSAVFDKLGFESSSCDHSLHRRVNEKWEWQNYAGYIDDGSGLFSENEEYTKFVKEMKQRFKLQQEEVQNASLGCEINQAGHVPAISEPGKPDYIKEDFPTVERGKYKVRISRPKKSQIKLLWFL